VVWLGFQVATHSYFVNFTRPAAGAREVVLLACVAWGIQRLARAAPPLRPTAQAGWERLERTLAAAPSSP